MLQITPSIWSIFVDVMGSTKKYKFFQKENPVQKPTYASRAGLFSPFLKTVKNDLSVKPKVKT